VGTGSPVSDREVEHGDSHSFRNHRRSDFVAIGQYHRKFLAAVARYQIAITEWNRC
jgi:hypothetical protein